MEYRVRSIFSQFARSEGRVNSYVVTDRPVGYKSEQQWPNVAQFDVSIRHDDEAQQRRAFEYAHYLNSHNKPMPAIGATKDQP